MFNNTNNTPLNITQPQPNQPRLPLPSQMHGNMQNHPSHQTHGHHMNQNQQMGANDEWKTQEKRNIMVANIINQIKKFSNEPLAQIEELARKCEQKYFQQSQNFEDYKMAIAKVLLLVEKNKAGQANQNQQNTAQGINPNMNQQQMKQNIPQNMQNIPNMNMMPNNMNVNNMMINPIMNSGMNPNMNPNMNAHMNSNINANVMPNNMNTGMNPNMTAGANIAGSSKEYEAKLQQLKDKYGTKVEQLLQTVNKSLSQNRNDNLVTIQKRLNILKQLLDGSPHIPKKIELLDAAEKQIIQWTSSYESHLNPKSKNMPNTGPTQASIPQPLQRQNPQQQGHPGTGNMPIAQIPIGAMQNQMNAPQNVNVNNQPPLGNMSNMKAISSQQPPKAAPIPQQPIQQPPPSQQPIKPEIKTPQPSGQTPSPLTTPSAAPGNLPSGPSIGAKREGVNLPAKPPISSPPINPSITQPIVAPSHPQPPSQEKRNPTLLECFSRFVNMANDSNCTLRKDLTRINSKLHNGNYKAMGQEQIDELKLPNTFQSATISLPAHILSPNSASPSLPSPSPSPSSILSPLTTPNVNNYNNNYNANANSYSSAIPKLNFFDNEKVGEKRKYDQFANSNQSILDEIQSSLSISEDTNDDLNCLFIQSNELMRCNQNGDNDLQLGEGKKRTNNLFLACDYMQRDRAKLDDLITFDRSLFALPSTPEEEERGEINLQIKKKSDITNQNRSKITVVFSDEQGEDTSTHFPDPSIPTFPPVAPQVYLNQQNLPRFIFPSAIENSIDYCKKLDERESYLTKELSKLPKNGITYRVIDDKQLKSLVFEIHHNKQIFNIHLFIPLDYPNLSPKYKLFDNTSIESTKGFQMIIDKFEKQLISTANPTVSDIVSSFVSSIEIC